MMDHKTTPQRTALAYPPASQCTVDTVVLDVGDVLERFDMAAMAHALLPDAALAEAFLARFHGTPVWLMLDRGTLDAPAAAQRFCEGHPEWLAPVGRFFDTWPTRMRPFPHTPDMLKALRTQGYRLLLLSNYNAHAFWRVPWHDDLRMLVDGIMLSADEHLLKPDLAIFARLCERFSVTPSRALFMDDRPQNIEAALYAGFHAAVFCEEADVRNALWALSQ